MSERERKVDAHRKKRKNVRITVVMAKLIKNYFLIKAVLNVNNSIYILQVPWPSL